MKRINKLILTKAEAEVIKNFNQLCCDEDIDLWDAVRAITDEDGSFIGMELEIIDV